MILQHIRLPDYIQGGGTGSFADYTGEILVRGKPVALHSPATAKANGIGMIW